MKKQLLFVIDSLTIGGAERSLVSLLPLLDYSRFDVDLQLFGYNGAFEQFLPKEVNLLPPLEYSNFLSKGIISQLLTFDVRKIVARWRYSLSIRRSGLLHSDKAILYWRCANGCFRETGKHYDVAIAYAQGIPTMYVVDKVQADRKLGWVNVNYTMTKETTAFQKRYYGGLDKIVNVSESVNEYMTGLYGSYNSKMVVVRDIVNPVLIEKMAEMEITNKIKHDKPILVTAARLNGSQKGLDISMEAAKVLKERGVEFRWYILGEGPFRIEIERYVAEHHLDDDFILLGATPNPFPYMKQATLYVQTSRHEGYGLSIAEARLLNIPVVTTEYEGVYMQMVPDCNGVVVPIDAVAVADAVQNLLDNSDKLERISEYQKGEKKGNVEEVEKFYSLIGQ